jgi:predicted kinase
MEAVIFTGLQASGKSSFYKERFFTTHVRISLDLLRTKNRERVFLRACLETQQRFVVDKTNPTSEQRAVYIEAARAAGFRVISYYFQSSIEDCLRRNAQRCDGERVPDKGIAGTYSQLQIPSIDEGFDEMWYVRLENGLFVVVEWTP